MNQETLAAISRINGLFAKFDAKTVGALSKICNPLAGIFTPEASEALNKLCQLSAITPELACSMAALEQHSKFAKLMLTSETA